MKNCTCNRPVAQIQQCTSPISRYTPFLTEICTAQLCTFLIQNGALWDICLIHCWIFTWFQTYLIDFPSLMISLQSEYYSIYHGHCIHGLEAAVRPGLRSLKSRFPHAYGAILRETRSHLAVRSGRMRLRRVTKTQLNKGVSRSNITCLICTAKLQIP